MKCVSRTCADPCEIPSFGGLPLAGAVVGLDNSAGNRKQIAAAFVALLSGCAGLAPVPKEALIPVATPCLIAADVPQRPDLATDAQLFAMSDAAFVFALTKDRLERQGYEGQLEAVIQACVTISEAPSPATLKPPVKRWWQW